MVITYGVQDWMLFPSGLAPPLTIRTTTDLVKLVTERPWLMEVTLLVTFGSMRVATYHFNRRSNFMIGLTTYVVDETHDARSKAEYESKMLDLILFLCIFNIDK